MRRRSAGFVSLATVLVLLGIAVIAILTWLPHARAVRTADEERVAASLVRPLLKAAAALPRLEFGDGAATELVAERVRRATGHEIRVEAVDPKLHSGGLWFVCGGYAFCIRRAAPKEAATPTPAAKPGPVLSHVPLEVYAWPASRWSMGRSAFFVAEDQALAHSRNLHSDYLGFESGHVPVGGAGRPRDRETAVSDGDYRGHDDDRWILAR